jgi:hypothetical protein
MNRHGATSRPSWSKSVTGPIPARALGALLFIEWGPTDIMVLGMNGAVLGALVG